MTLDELKLFCERLSIDEDGSIRVMYGGLDDVRSALQTLPDLIAAVEALRDLLCEMSEPTWDDSRISYEERQITKGEVEKCRAILSRLGVE